LADHDIGGLGPTLTTQERDMKTTAALFIALAFAATTPAFGRSHHQQHSGATAYSTADTSYAAPRERNDIPWAPF
jgi:hypothetical protein